MKSAASLIAVVGNVNLDIKTGPIPADQRILADGETSVSEIYEAIGGGGGNTAVAAARMGGDVFFCGAIGADALGERLKSFLAQCGVKPHLAVKHAPTGRSIALNWDHHHRHFVSCLPSSLLLEPGDVDMAALVAGGCRHLYRADIWFAPRMLAEGNLQLMRAARQHGMQTSIDINWDPHWHMGRDDPIVCERIDAVTRVLPEVTYVHGNERELRFFARAHTLAEAAGWFFSHGAQSLVIHLGPEGSAVIGADGTAVQVPAEEVSEVVSEAGTGDVFTAAFLLRDEMDLHKRLAECNAAAAMHLSGRSAYLPRLDA